MSRQDSLQVKFSESEWKTLLSDAEGFDVSLTDYIHTAVLDYKPLKNQCQEAVEDTERLAENVNELIKDRKTLLEMHEKEREDLCEFYKYLLDRARQLFLKTSTLWGWLQWRVSSKTWDEVVYVAGGMKPHGDDIVKEEEDF